MFTDDTDHHLVFSIRGVLFADECDVLTINEGSRCETCDTYFTSGPFRKRVAEWIERLEKRNVCIDKLFKLQFVDQEVRKLKGWSLPYPCISPRFKYKIIDNQKHSRSAYTRIQYRDSVIRTLRETHVLLEEHLKNGKFDDAVSLISTVPKCKWKNDGEFGTIFGTMVSDVFKNMHAQSKRGWRPSHTMRKFLFILKEKKNINIHKFLRTHFGKMVIQCGKETKS